MPLLIGDNRKPQWPFVLDKDNPLAKGLVGWWPGCPSGGGRIYDLSGNNHHLLLGGSGFWGEEKDGGNGSLRCNGTTNNATGLVVTAKPSTMACWVKLTAAAVGDFMGVGSSTNYFKLRTTAANVFQASERAGGGAESADSAALVLNKWYLVTGRWLSDTSRSLTIDGNVTTTNTVSVIPTLTTSLALGTLGLSGLICSPAVWNRSLSDNEVWQLYDPSTRWSLRYQTKRKVWSFAPAQLTHYTLACDSGSFVITGTAATLEVGRAVQAASGSYAIAGTAAAFVRTYVIAAAPGAYVITGTAADLRAGYVVSADPGAFAITGTDATFARTYIVDAGAGSYAIAGTDANLEVGRRLQAAGGAYVVSGTDATLTYTPIAGAYTLVCESGAYVITGSDVALTYTPIVPIPIVTVTGGSGYRGLEAIRKKEEAAQKEDVLTDVEIMLAVVAIDDWIRL